MLRAELVEERGELLAWVLASVVAVLACAAAGETEAPLTAVVLVALGALFYVGRRLHGVWRALRDYEKSETEPRRAYVALLNDPNARVTRPLLGLWNEEPMSQGRLPRAEAVYRCDEERSALMSPPGRVIVHEAWVDTGKHSGSRPAMGGGRRRSRPAASRRCTRQVVPRVADRLRAAYRGRPLTVQSPHPDTEPSSALAGTLISEQTPVFGRWARQFGLRLAALLAVALIFTWLT